MRSRPGEQRRAANMIYFLAAIVPLSGACKGSAGAQAGTNTISSGGSEIRRARFGKRSGADWPQAGPSSTTPGHSLPSKGGHKALWMLGLRLATGKEDWDPNPGCSASLKPPWGPVVSPPEGMLPHTAPGGTGSPATVLPHQRATGGSSDPARLGRDSVFDPPEQDEARAALASAARAALWPQASAAGRALVTLPHTPRLGSPSKGVTPWERFKRRIDSPRWMDTPHCRGGARQRLARGNI